MVVLVASAMPIPLMSHARARACASACHYTFPPPAYSPPPRFLSRLPPYSPILPPKFPFSLIPLHPPASSRRCAACRARTCTRRLWRQPRCRQGTLTRTRAHIRACRLPAHSMRPAPPSCARSTRRWRRNIRRLCRSRRRCCQSRPAATTTAATAAAAAEVASSAPTCPSGAICRTRRPAAATQRRRAPSRRRARRLFRAWQRPCI
mmetsp:Transcript_22102/g.65985  ORF Transcript_22102/g.65985 Transcript_22102/m.65985 type:complete len:206 (+) Transcript_22102:190-807(+)